MKKELKFVLTGLALSSLVVFNSGCGDSETGTTENDPIDTIDSIIGGGGNDVGPIGIGGQIFSIPSPVQTAYLIKDVGADFNSDILNPRENADNYSTSFLKALNMGVYGADLGYLTIYDNTDESMKYLTSVRGLAKDLDLGGAFDEDLIERFSSNIGDQDSMLVFVSEAYKNADNYLKDNDKDEIAALVVTGGWIEATYFASRTAVETNDQQIIDRLGDQKNTLHSLILMLEQYRGNQDYDDLAYELEDLYMVFEEIKYTYEFVPPVTDPSNKLTMIKSKHTVELTEDHLNAIIEKIESIRNEIVQ